MSAVLCVLGAGGHGKVVADAARASGRWSAVQLYDDRWPSLQAVGEFEVRGDAAALQARVLAEPTELVVAIGDNELRLSWSRRLREAGARLARVVHPFSFVSAMADVGPGSVVLAGAVLNAGASTGESCIVNTRASIDHDCRLGDAVHVCPGAVLAGTVCIDDLAWIGAGATIIQGIKIGQGAFVGAGATVIREVSRGTTVVGCPAREIQHVS